MKNLIIALFITIITIVLIVFLLKDGSECLSSKDDFIPILGLIEIGVAIAAGFGGSWLSTKYYKKFLN